MRAVAKQSSGCSTRLPHRFAPRSDGLITKTPLLTGFKKLAIKIMNTVSEAVSARLKLLVIHLVQVLNKAITTQLSIQAIYLSAKLNQVSITASGFNDTESMPCSISHKAKSGWSDGP